MNMKDPLTTHIDNYAHDFRDLALNELQFTGMLRSFVVDIHADLLAIADQGEYEEMRKALEHYFITT